MRTVVTLPALVAVATGLALLAVFLGSNGGQESLGVDGFGFGLAVHKQGASRIFAQRGSTHIRVTPDKRGTVLGTQTGFAGKTPFGGSASLPPSRGDRPSPLSYRRHRKTSKEDAAYLWFFRVRSGFIRYF